MRGKRAHPTREGLDLVSVDRAEIYRCWPPVRLQVPILVQPLAVNDYIPSEAEIYMVVLGLKVGILGVCQACAQRTLRCGTRSPSASNIQRGESWSLW